MQIKTEIVSYRTADNKPVKQEVNGTVIHPPLVVPVYGLVIEVIVHIEIKYLLDFLEASGRFVEQEAHA